MQHVALCFSGGTRGFPRDWHYNIAELDAIGSYLPLIEKTTIAIQIDLTNRFKIGKRYYTSEVHDSLSEQSLHVYNSLIEFAKNPQIYLLVSKPAVPITTLELKAPIPPTIRVLKYDGNFENTIELDLNIISG